MLWRRLSRICWSLVSDCTLTVKFAALTDGAVAEPAMVTLPADLRGPAYRVARRLHESELFPR